MRRDPGCSGPWTRLLDRERALRTSRPPPQAPQAALHDAEVAQRDRDLGVLGPVDRLLDRERALLRRPRRLKLPKLPLHDAEVRQRDRDLGVLGPVDRLLDRERALVAARAPWRTRRAPAGTARRARARVPSARAPRRARRRGRRRSGRARAAARTAAIARAPTAGRATPDRPARPRAPRALRAHRCAGRAARDVLDEAMHRKRAVGGRGQQRVAQQQLDGVVDRRAATGASSPTSAAASSSSRGMRSGARCAHTPSELLGERLRRELLERQAPDRRDRVLVPRRPARREQLRRTVAQPLQVARQRDRLRVDVRRGLLERQRQIAQRVGHLVEHRRVPLTGARRQELAGLLALPHVERDRPRVQRAPVRMRPGRDEHMPAVALGDAARRSPRAP